jgi:hypothetical protein
LLARASSTFKQLAVIMNQVAKRGVVDLMEDVD